MSWIEWIQLGIFLFRLLGLLPKEKRAAAEKEVFGVMAKLAEDDNIA